ncbi:MAG: glutaredoxin 3 [Proteobacteria bacterium]|nr:glutaredoxin 3 [Pseudomonadota bacterium]
MPEVEIYTSMMCGFCYRAKALLKAKNVAYTEIGVSLNPVKRVEMIERAAGARSVPQIFVDGRHIGDCDELYRLESLGELDAILTGS